MKLSTCKHHIFVCFLTGRRAILTSASWLVDNLVGFVQPMKDLTLSITWQMVVITGLWQPNQVNNNNLVQLAVFPHHSHLCLVVLQLFCRIRGHQLGEAMFRARYAVLCPDVFNLTIAQLLPCMYVHQHAQRPKHAAAKIVLFIPCLAQVNCGLCTTPCFMWVHWRSS